MKVLKLKLLVVCAVALLLGVAPLALGDWDEGDSHKMHYPQLPKLDGWDVAFEFGRLADDWQCSQTGPVEDIHFWVSWEMDMVGPINGFSVRIWSDDPCGPNGYSEPNELLWERDFDAGEFTVRDMPYETQGWFDPFTGFWILNDHGIWQQINIEDINDPFIQQEGIIYWLEIDMWGANFCGWKESGSPQFRDDAVYWASGWFELIDPETYESLDLAFVITGKEEEVVKWEQPPCLDDPNCMDVDATDDNWMWYAPQALADDFNCTTTGLITDIHIWGSWLADEPPDFDPNHVWFTLCLYSNDPCGPMGWSEPNELLWMKEFHGGDFDVEMFAEGPEAYYIPCEPNYFPDADFTCWLYSFYIDPFEAFVQEEGTIYWLALQAHIYLPDPAFEHRFGWKNSSEQWNDDAVWAVGELPGGLGGWNELTDPCTGESVDLAFKITTVEEDYGDAPDPTYPTLLANDGARHIIAGPWLGPADDAPDPEGDGQPHPSALGDDNDGNDDEDGVTIPVLHQGHMETITIEVSDPAGWTGFFELWIDWNGDGDWDDPGEGTVAMWLPPGTNPIAVWVPLNSVVGQTFARCRINGSGWIGPTGLASDGEVEDYEVWIEETLVDFSDAPDPNYPTLLASNGARHIIAPGFYLGNGIDAEFDGQPDPCALGDDNDGNDDEDGVVFTSPLIPGQQATVDVTASAPGFLNAWMDFNADGDWADPCEQIFNDVSLIAGVNSLTFQIPASAPGNIQTFARFRFTSTASGIWFACWDNPRQCHGDADGQYAGRPPNEIWVTLFDLDIFFWAYGSTYLGPAYDPCADFDRDGDVDDDDFAILQTYYLQPNIPADCPTTSGDLSYYGPADDGETEDYLLAVEVKPAVPHLKWSQPPIEMDPTAATPTFWGWDELSYTNDPCCEHGFGWQVVADDFRCLGSMPITSIHWWGSHYGWEDANEMPPASELPVAWRIGIWSNVPADPCIPYSRPEVLLSQIEVPADRVDVNQVGTDEFCGIYPYDAAYQYTLYLEPEEVFWQEKFEPNTVDNIFWLSIAAVYPDLYDPLYPWGWKTRPWSWMDDAVTFSCDVLQPGMVLDPYSITPIEDPLYYESYDVAFELDTDPNYIKWEQPFTGIRDWPHYEDEMSMAFATGGEPDILRLVADDWRCDGNTPVNAIVWWGSYINYAYNAGHIEEIPPPMPLPVKPDYFLLNIWTDVPATQHAKWTQKPDLTDINGIDVDAVHWDTPPWKMQVLADDFECITTGPITDIYIWGSWLDDELPPGGPNDVEFWVEIFSDNPVGPNGWSVPDDMLWWGDFWPGDFEVSPYAEDLQEGYYSPCTGFYDPVSDTNCWLYHFHIDPCDAFIQQGDPCDPNVYWLVVQALPLGPERFGWKTSTDHHRDDAVWKEGWSGTPGPWNELRYPPGHPFGGQTIDLAFEINPGEGPSYSHPNDIIWEYRAYDYDEVLVGYDKHPLGEPNEPVFRYSVRLPEEEWFEQDDVNNNVYWLSVVAVYETSVPNYDWGWTNHKHMFNDDAVEGYFDLASGWFWYELYDQTGMSEDMSFILFTDPYCFPQWHLDFSQWVKAGCPECWCPAPDGSDYQCKGDADNAFVGKDKYGGRKWVTGNDYNILVPGWQQYDGPNGEVGSWICADFDHAFVGKDKNGSRKWVTGNDYNILVAGWQVYDNNDVFTTNPCFP